jgi:hypothetical protein
MRSVLSVILITYFVGVSIILSPTIQSKWSVAPASDLAANVGQELPYALAWPARLVHELEASGRVDNATLRGPMPPEG